MNLVKTTVRNRLSNDSLNPLLRIWRRAITLQEFHETYIRKCVHYSDNSKNRHLNQQKRKDYQKCQSKKANQRHFRIVNLSSSLSDSSSSDCEYSNASDDNQGCIWSEFHTGYQLTGMGAQKNDLKKQEVILFLKRKFNETHKDFRIN